MAHLLEGSVQRAANKIRVNAQLIDARTDAHLWAQTYDRDLADMFAIQSEIATAIADQLQAKLSPNEKAAIEKPPTTDLAAFDLYTRAKTQLLSIGFSASNEQNTQQAIELLNQAVARDPTFFEAYYQLVYAHGWAYSVVGSDHTPARIALAERLSKRQLGCGQMLAKRISRERTISITACAITMAHWLSWKWRGAVYPMIRVSLS